MDRCCVAAVFCQSISHAMAFFRLTAPIIKCRPLERQLVAPILEVGRGGGEEKEDVSNLLTPSKMTLGSRL
jgi:hypothetical protein